MTAHWPDWPLFNLNFNEDVFWQVNQQCILDECHIYLATQSYSSPPVFQLQQVHWNGREGRGGKLAAAYSPLLINCDYTRGGSCMCIHAATPHINTDVVPVFVERHIIQTYLSSHHRG